MVAGPATAWTEYDRERLEADLRAWDFNPVHARSLLRDFYARDGQAIFDAPSLPKKLLEKVREIPATRSRVAQERISADGTVKLLVEMHAGGSVEAVLMPGYRPDRAAVCVSSQIGCAMGCDFCASTRFGLERDLHSSEIVDQFVHLKRRASAMNRRITSLVMMGMGEPLLNYDNVIAAVKRIADPDIGGLGWRQVTISTVGVVPGIDRLANEDLNVHLAVSLHAADDATRDRLVPLNRKWKIADVMEAARRFHATTKRIPTIEWCMIADVNDGEEQAVRLSELMRGFRAHVNLIPYNWIGQGLSGVTYRKPGEERIKSFAKILQESGVVVHRRDTRGEDIEGACGQLVSLARSSGRSSNHL
jgi:23S rRNA (adenine2503-C2)-methyltransferase